MAIHSSVLDRLYEYSGKYYRWTVANSSLIQEVYILGRSPSYGRKGNMVRKLMGMIKFDIVLLLAMRVVAMIDVTRWWWKAGADRKKQVEGCRIFVGFGAGPEEIMWRQFMGEDNTPAIHLDQTRPETFGALHRPSLTRIWEDVWRCSTLVFDFLQKATCEPIVSHRLDFITFATIRMGQYAFFLRWWTDMLSRNIHKAVFISADTPAFACLDSGYTRAEFRQHGLLRKSVLMPPFTVMQLLTKQEKLYYLKLLPGTQVEVVRSNHQVIEHRKVILLASVYDCQNFNKLNDLQKLKDVFLWAKQCGMQVIVRRHPRECDDFWRQHFPEVTIDNRTDSFEEALFRVRPSILLTWHSTTLIDALRCNVVPVSISTPDSQHVQDIIVKLSEHCLMWPAQRAILDNLIANETKVEVIIQRLTQSDGTVREF